MIQAGNPSYSEDRNKEDWGTKLAQAKVQESTWKKQNKQN
jgi:hypothetical protein